MKIVPSIYEDTQTGRLPEELPPWLFDIYIFAEDYFIAKESIS